MKIAYQRNTHLAKPQHGCMAFFFHADLLCVEKAF